MSYSLFRDKTPNDRPPRGGTHHFGLRMFRSWAAPAVAREYWKRKTPREPKSKTNDIVLENGRSGWVGVENFANPSSSDLYCWSRCVCTRDSYAPPSGY